MTRPLASHVLLFFALAACSDKTQPQTGSQTHFLETCNALCPEPYECICGACTLECKSDGPCRDHVDNAHCSVALSTDGLECSTDALVCDVACERNSDCNPLGAGYMCEGGRCRGAVRNSTSSSGATGETPPPPAICDGSDDIRLGIWNTLGSFTTPGSKFMDPIAGSFAFVDGRCHFYASTDALSGVATGSLDDADARQLAIEIRLASFPRFQAYNYQSCMDGGGSAISDGVHMFACMCGECGDDAPEGLTDSMAAGQTWIKQLTAQGTPWNAEVRAVATDFLNTLHLEQPQTWPLTLAIDEILVPNAEITVDSGAGFDAGEADALRQLRKQQAMVVPRGEDIYVTDGVKKYSLFVRDELPVDTTASLKAFETKSWKVIEDAANRESKKDLAARDAGTP